MNWGNIVEEILKQIKLIIEKYPKAHKKVDDWFDERYDINGLECPVDVRDLYDFFDEQEIYVEIQVQYCDGMMFLPTIETMWDEDTNLEQGFWSHTEAAEKAFEKAFEVLENKLKMEGVTGNDSKDI